MTRTTVFALSTVFLIASSPISAQGWIEPLPGRAAAPTVVKLRSDVTVRVTGRVALVEVEELFRNDGGGLGEGDYLYPLPGEAVFTNFSLFQGDEELTGETMNADRARAIYEEIVRRKRDPALIEMFGYGMIRARVFPIAPGETRKITLRYTQVMARAGDALEFRYAGAGPHAGPRPVASDVPGRRFAPMPVPTTFELVADRGADFRDPFSPTHRLQIDRNGGRLRVRPADAVRGRLALFLPLASEGIGITVATHQPPGREDGYFMLTVSPPQLTTDAVPRDLTVVLDVSGSMSGRKMTQARAALHQLLGSLHPRDRFRLVAFSSGVRPFHTEWSAATGGTLERARAWVDQLRADGGTNIAGALAEAFAAPSPRDRLPIVLFVTDGLPSVGEQDPDAIARIAASNRGAARVFAFGVGYDVNTLLLDRLTAEAHGTTQYVEPDADVEHALSTLATKIQHPVLTDLAIDRTPVEVTEIYPVTLPDLFAGEELILFGRYARSSRDRSGEVVVTGVRNGRLSRFASQVSFPAHHEGNSFIPRLWASRKLGHLTRSIRLEGRTDALVDEIRRTALRYGLLSEYTAYLVQEPEAVVASETPADLAPVRAAPLPQPGSGAVGRDAVRAAERARQQRQVRSEADLEAIPMPDHDTGRRHRRLAGRQFTLVDSTWIDVRHRDATHTVTIRPFSAAYFRLLTLVPELRLVFGQLHPVVVTGETVSIKLDEQGIEHLDDREMARLVTSFRGS